MIDRWTKWAHSLAARHERFTARQNRLVMTLLEPLRMSVSINQRFESFAFAAFPKIRVSIGPILNEIGRGEFASFPLFQTSMAFRTISSLESKVVGSGPGDSVTRMTLIKERFAHERFARDVKQNEIHDTSEVVGHTNLIRINQGVTQSPVVRVFQRFQERDPGIMLRKLLFENESRKVVQRVSREHLRVEHRTRGDMVIRTQTKPSVSVEDRRGELEAQFASVPKTRGPSWPEKPPEINVEQLTEQVIRKIDHRITAYRERLGRAF